MESDVNLGPGNTYTLSTLLPNETKKNSVGMTIDSKKAAEAHLISESRLATAQFSVPPAGLLTTTSS